MVARSLTKNPDKIKALAAQEAPLSEPSTATAKLPTRNFPSPNVPSPETPPPEVSLPNPPLFETVPYVSTRRSWPNPGAGTAAAERDDLPKTLPGAARSENEERIAPFVDPDYYRDTYGDVYAGDVDPVVHYARYGWKLRRNPSRLFDTGFYLDSNPDVARAEVNPLWHYVVTGRDEGRRPLRPGVYGRDVLRTLKTADQKTAGYEPPQAISFLHDEALFNILVTLPQTKQLVVSVSHDDYTRAVGGTQLFIASEQENFNRDDAAYLHISPLIPRLRLAMPSDDAVVWRLILNGKLIGFTNVAELSAVLLSAREQLAQRLLVCHCLLGHRIGEIIRLSEALQPLRAVYWLHDYSSICGSVTLLRNDVTFCGAPPPNSVACHICIHGRDRSDHVTQFQRLFAAINFDIAAPSETARTIWAAHAHLPFRQIHVHPHASVQFTSVRRSVIDIRRRGTRECPIRVAFAGHGETHKGWQAFASLMVDCESLGLYKFYQFSAEAARSSGPLFEHVPVEVRTQARDNMIRALQNHTIDLVLVLSSWPETFSYVTHEAIAAGADIVTFADSGNVAAEVLRTGRGLVVKNYAALREFFVSGSAARYVRLCYEQGNQSGELHHHGTTATLWRKLSTLPDVSTRDATPSEALIVRSSIGQNTKVLSE